MKRVAIIGNAGGGKTALSRELSVRLNIPVFHLDLYWTKSEPNWRYATEEEFYTEHEAIVKGEQWIIEGGMAYWKTIKRRFDLADTIFYVDLPIFTHFWCVTTRQIRTIFKPRDDLPEGAPVFRKTVWLYSLMWKNNKVERSRLQEMLRTLAGRKNVIHIRRRTELRIILDTCHPKDSSNYQQQRTA